MILVNALSRQGDTVIFGTDIGLLLYDTATNTWRRALPTQEISQVVVGDVKDAPMVALTVPRGSSNGYSSPSGHRLFVVSARTGKAEETSKTLPPGRDSNATLTVAEQGTLWLTYDDCFYKAEPRASGWVKINDQGEVVEPGSEKQTLPRGFGDDWDPFYQSRFCQ